METVTDSRSALFCGSSVPTFRDNLSVPSSRVRKSWDFLTIEDETDRLSQNVVLNYHSTLRKIPEERSSHLDRGGSLKSRIVTDSTQFTDQVFAFCGDRSTRDVSPLRTRSSLYRIVNTAFLRDATLPVLFLHLNE